MKVTILREAEIRESVPLDLGALEAVSDGFSRLAAGSATLPPVMSIEIPESHGEVHVKGAYIHGFDHFAVKVASGFYDNHLLGLPTSSGMMIVVNAKTGFPEAILLDNGYLTDLRTGIAGAIAADHLAREHVDTVGVFGSGGQARYQIRALRLVRDFRRLIVYGIESQQVRRYAEAMGSELGIDVEIADRPEAVVRQSEIVVTTTPARQPYLRVDWLHPGLHITCMGSDAPHKQELYPDVFERADRIVCDRKSQCFRLGELHHALEAGVLSEQSCIWELGELTAGRAPRRQSEEEITLCDLTGVGVQDTAVALLAYQRALGKGLGVRIDS